LVARPSTIVGASAAAVLAAVFLVAHYVNASVALAFCDTITRTTTLPLHCNKINALPLF
jgi:hypothetical protein